MGKLKEWYKKNSGWVKLTGGLVFVILCQHGANKLMYKAHDDLLNRLLDVTRDPDRYIEENCQLLADTVATDLENTLSDCGGEAIPKEDIDEIIWGLKNCWHNYIYD